MLKQGRIGEIKIFRKQEKIMILNKYGNYEWIDLLNKDAK